MMDASLQVRRPQCVVKGGDGEYAFFALIRDPWRTPSRAQVTKYHSFGGYLFRGIVEPEDEYRGETMSVYVDCAGPDGKAVTAPCRVGAFWGFWVEMKLSLVHPENWSELGITLQDLESKEEQISRTCRLELPTRTPASYTRSVKHKFDVPYVDQYSGNGLRHFAQSALLQKGLFGDKDSNFVLHFRLSLHSEYSENEVVDGSTGTNELHYAQMQKSQAALFTDALEMRSAIFERIVDYDSKLSTIKNEVVLGIVRKEMEFLSNVGGAIPVLCDYI